MGATTITQPIKVRPETRVKYEKFAELKRLKIVEVADLAIEALGTLSREQLDALIERRPVNRRKSATAA